MPVRIESPENDDACGEWKRDVAIVSEIRLNVLCADDAGWDSLVGEAALSADLITPPTSADERLDVVKRASEGGFLQKTPANRVVWVATPVGHDADPDRHGCERKEPEEGGNGGRFTRR